MKASKTLLAAALAALPLAAAAQATPAAPAPGAPPKPPAAPLVQVYGTLNVNLQWAEASGATAPGSNVQPRLAISIDSSNVGVRGTFDLLHGIKAVYQCETQASIDGEDTRALCNRNSRVGLQSGFGTLFYGNWDTPFKAGSYGTKADDPFGNTDVFGYNGLMGSPGYGVRSSAFNTAATVAAAPLQAGSVTGTAFTASFDQRAANSVAYWSPKFGGLSAKVQFSVNEFRASRDANGTADPMLLSAVVNYDQGPLSVFASGEYHEDTYGLRVINGGGNTGLQAGKDLAWRVGAGYDLPLGVGTLNVMGMFEQLTFGQDDAVGATSFSDYSRMAWLVGAKFRTGNHELRARYSQALDPSIDAGTGGTLAANAEDDLGAQNYALGYAYHLAKNTQVFLFFTQMMNDDRARYTFGVSGPVAIVAGNTLAGHTLTAGGLGIRLAF
jgi:predicted porin